MFCVWVGLQRRISYYWSKHRAVTLPCPNQHLINIQFLREATVYETIVCAAAVHTVCSFPTSGLAFLQQLQIFSHLANFQQQYRM